MKVFVSHSVQSHWQVVSPSVLCFRCLCVPIIRYWEPRAKWRNSLPSTLLGKIELFLLFALSFWSWVLGLQWFYLGDDFSASWWWLAQNKTVSFRQEWSSPGATTAATKLNISGNTLFKRAIKIQRSLWNRLLNSNEKFGKKQVDYEPWNNYKSFGVNSVPRVIRLKLFKPTNHKIKPRHF